MMWKKVWKKYGTIIAAAVFLTAAGFCYGFARSKDGKIILNQAVESGAMFEGAESARMAEGAPENAVGIAQGTLSTSAENFSGNSGSGPGESLGTAGAEGAKSGWYVHICGEVENPGVYMLPEGSRVFEVVEAAGGFTAEAADASLNLADVIADGMQIVVLSDEEFAVVSEERASESGGLVNINKASKEQLMTLSGIGESRAEDIIRYREESGGFQTIEDIMKVTGIKDAAFQKIKNSITV